MAYEVNGKALETTNSGYLVNPEEWDNEAGKIAGLPESMRKGGY